ncbi:dCMP deaminase [Bacillus phage SP-15]|uniref:dCMP deaminase n=1 Tax=Bacillus phage SP-15 TaxID=1792032 RepID=A0A127AWN5_9CAUD|nr:dCMP deaminase [Bacillus phage SP-15]AMM45020.1 dCMP deaminase [Bacillus phage SP-15]
MNKRPPFSKVFMDEAELWSSRSTCTRLSVGAVIVRDNRTVAQGYNGSIAGHPHCNEVGDLMYENGCKRTIHAEMNALMMCAKYGIPTAGTVLYVTHYPCPDCMKHINQAGIKEVVFKHDYKHRYENNFHEGIKLTKYTEEIENA